MSNDPAQEPSPNSTLADQALSVLKASNTGTLATHSIKHSGFPFASIANYCISDQGEPLFLFSSMATHSRNLKSNNKASFLVAVDGDLGSSRVTLVGTIEELSEKQIPAARESYLVYNPDALQWINFSDFSFYRLNVADCYIVAGFGKMGWVSSEELKEALGKDVN